MGIRSFSPITPVQRYKKLNSNDEITATQPYKPLTEGRKRSSGRNNRGIITVRRRGGGHKQLYRIVDFKRDRLGVPAIIETVEYDPGRSANIALVKYVDGQRKYIIAPKGISVGDKVESGLNADFKVGNTLPLEKIPVGTLVHNVEMKKGKGAQIARSAGTFVEIVARDGDYVQLKMPSGEVRLIRGECVATIGQVGNLDHLKVISGSAGRSRWLGKRPKVRGVAMNPVDHPMGGGEGRTSGGGHPVSPWGKKAKGKKTRNNKETERWIVRHRPKKRKS